MRVSDGFARVLVLAFSGDPAPSVQRREHTLAILTPAERGLRVVQELTWNSLPEVVGPLLQPDTLWAVDFPCSFPRGFVAHAAGESETWDAALAWADVHGELTLAAGRPPFWGRRNERRPKPDALPGFGLASLHRACERAYPPAKSVFHVAGPDAVGTAALRGMAWLRRSGLRARVHAWPFDGAADGTRPVLAEVLPRAFWPDMRIEDPAARRARIAAVRSEGWQADEVAWAAAERPFGFRAVTAVAGLAALFARDPGLLADPARAPVADLALRYEGWALGPLGAPGSDVGQGAGTPSC